VRELAEACRADGIKLGLYLSPWDRNAPVYGDTPRYNDLYAVQLTELLTWYGAVHEVWFDGANGEGPNGRRQQYDWPRVHATVRRLQPDAVMFSDAGPDVRWIGNERGTAGETNWSTVDPAAVPYPGAEGPLVTRMLQEGDPAGSVWRPGETDVSIRPGWFYHPAEDARVRTVDDLVDIYFSSVGRNSKLLLNVPPDRTGRIAAVDEERLRGMRRRLDLMFATELSRGRRWSRRIVGGVPQWTVDLRRDVSIGVVDLREPIERGQVVASYRVEGRRGDAWRLLSQGTTIGARKLDRLTPVEVSEVRVTITSAMGLPAGLEVRLFE
jgi:alpha-L-fucosidase